MQEHNQKDTGQQAGNKSEPTGRGHGAQGIDKAPGEETPQDNVQFSQEAFKGKKVDADPSQEGDKPAEQDL